ncbi:hypothetical protein DFH06DRAFT_967898, partial [Mycena polygramma]
VWGSSPPSSKRNASMSSLATGNVGGEMQGDSNFRPNAGEPWSAPRSVSGTWDDNALKTSMDSQSQLHLRQTRQRQSHAGQFPGPRADDRPSGSKNSHMNVGKDSNPARYSSSSTKPLGAGTYPTQQPSFPLGYDPLQPSATADNELALAMRGMVVEDDMNAHHSRQQAPPAMPIPPQVSNAQIRGTSQQRTMYNTYPTTEYGFYPPARDSFVEYPYVGYGGADPSAYGSSGVPMSPSLYPGVPQSLHPNTVDIRQQQPVYFDYNAATRPPSQFFFPPPQPMMYPPHSPMLSSPIPPSSAPVTLAEKKLEMQVRFFRSDFIAIVEV